MSTLNIGYIPADWSGNEIEGDLIEVGNPSFSQLAEVTVVFDSSEGSRIICQATGDESTFDSQLGMLVVEDSEESTNLAQYISEALNIELDAELLSKCIRIVAQESDEWEDSDEITFITEEGPEIGGASNYAGKAYVHFYDSDAEADKVIAVSVVEKKARQAPKKPTPAPVRETPDIDRHEHVEAPRFRTESAPAPTNSISLTKAVIIGLVSLGIAVAATYFIASSGGPETVDPAAASAEPLAAQGAVIPGESIQTPAVEGQSVQQAMGSTTSELAKPSFDCSKASTQVEYLICENQALAKLDSDLAAVYRAARSDANAASGGDDLRSTQHTWLQQRNQCSDTSCLEFAYRLRINDLCKNYTGQTSALCSGLGG